MRGSAGCVSGGGGGLEACTDGRIGFPQASLTLGLALPFSDRNIRSRGRRVWLDPTPGKHAVTPSRTTQDNTTKSSTVATTPVAAGATKR